MDSEIILYVVLVADVIPEAPLYASVLLIPNFK
jgi:hypothetical protein